MQYLDFDFMQKTAKGVLKTMICLSNSTKRNSDLTLFKTGVSKNAVLAHYFLPNFLDLKKLNKTLCNKGFWNHYGWFKN
jgi:hypothetical protein